MAKTKKSTTEYTPHIKGWGATQSSQTTTDLNQKKVLKVTFGDHWKSQYAPLPKTISMSEMTQSLYKQGLEPALRQGRKNAAKILHPGGTKSLRTLRLEKGLSQDELAELTGIQQYRISRYERKEEKPQFETMNKLMEALGIDVQTLWDSLK